MERLCVATSAALRPQLAVHLAAAGVVAAPASAAAVRLSAVGLARPASTLAVVARSAAAAAAVAAAPRATVTAASPAGGCGRGNGGGGRERGGGTVAPPRAPAADGTDEPPGSDLSPPSPWPLSPVGLAFAGRLGGGAPVTPSAATTAVAAVTSPVPTVTTLFSAAASTTNTGFTSLAHPSASVAVTVGGGGGAMALPLSPHPPLSLAGILAGAITDAVDWLWDGLLRAVPKKKVPHGRKRRRMTGKYLTPARHVIECKTCGRWKRSHTYCKPSCVGRQELGV